MPPCATFTGASPSSFHACCSSCALALDGTHHCAAAIHRAALAARRAAADCGLRELLLPATHAAPPPRLPPRLAGGSFLSGKVLRANAAEEDELERWIKARATAACVDPRGVARLLALRSHVLARVRRCWPEARRKDPLASPRLASPPLASPAPATAPPTHAVPTPPPPVAGRERVASKATHAAAPPPPPPEVVRAWSPPKKAKKTFNQQQLRREVERLRARWEVWQAEQEAMRGSSFTQERKSAASRTAPSSRSSASKDPSGCDEQEKPSGRSSGIGRRSSGSRSIHDPEYGSPEMGTKTYARGQRAHAHVAEELCVLCEVIESCKLAGRPGGPRAWSMDDDPSVTLVLFEDLFEAYAHISDKVVGMLLRARKHSLLFFEGETLFQGQDDEVPILLLMSARQAREKMRAQGLQSGTVVACTSSQSSDGIEV
ncbi:hypothetical protein AB1Y20_008945 [Prymnesium parvum]|uniref:Costars domain-containing protein n=1 Tax=Prymnesium parvum TaxID=97485 RepID=A0AB34K2F3_PRYPA